MYINNREYEDNALYNLGFIKGKIEVLLDTNINRNKEEILSILDEMNDKVSIVIDQVEKYIKSKQNYK